MGGKADDVRGSKPVTLEQLGQIETPGPVRRWRPMAHASVLSLVEDVLRQGGYEVTARDLYVSRGSARFVGILDLDREVAEGLGLVVAITSSNDQSYPLDFYGGYRSSANGACSFRSQLLAKRKHTPGGKDRYSGDIADAVAGIERFGAGELVRIRGMQQTPIDTRAADSILLRVFEEDIIRVRALSQAVREWRQALRKVGSSPSYWSLSSILTGVIAESSKGDILRRCIKATLRLNAMIAAEPELRPVPAHPSVAASA